MTDFRAHTALRARVAAAMNIANPSPDATERQAIAKAVEGATTFEALPTDVQARIESWERAANAQADAITASGAGEFHLAGRHNQANHGRRKLNPTFSPFTKAQKAARQALRDDNLDPDTPTAWRTPNTPAKKVARPRGSIAHPRKGEREQPPVPTPAQKKTAAAADAQTAKHVAAKKANPNMSGAPAKKTAAKKAAPAVPNGADQDLTPQEADSLKQIVPLAAKTGNQVPVANIQSGGLRGLLGLQRKGHVSIHKDSSGRNIVTTTPQGRAAHKLLEDDKIKMVPFVPQGQKAAAPAAPATPATPAPLTPAQATQAGRDALKARAAKKATPAKAAPSGPPPSSTVNPGPTVKSPTATKATQIAAEKAAADAAQSSRKPTASAPSARSTSYPPFIDGKTEASDLDAAEADQMRVLKKHIKTTTGSVNIAQAAADPKFSVTAHGKLIRRGLINHGSDGNISFTPEGLQTVAALPKATKAVKKAAPAKVATPAASTKPLADLPKTQGQKTMLQGLGRVMGGEDVTTWRNATSAQGWNASSRNALEKAGYIQIDRAGTPVKIRLTPKGRDAVDALERGEGNLTDAARRKLQAGTPAAPAATPGKPAVGARGFTGGQAANAMPSKSQRRALPDKDQVGPYGNPKAALASEKFGTGKGIGDDSIVPQHKNPGDIVSLLDDDNDAYNAFKDAWDNTQNGRTRNGGNEYLTELSKLQGTSGKPQVVSVAEIDAAIANGARPGYRGVTTPYNGPPPSARDIQNGLRNDPETYYGNGIYGNGIYIAEDPSYADGYGDRRDKYSIVRMAISPNAKIITYDDLQNEFYKWENDNPGSRVARIFRRDLAAYALARGYDAIATPSGTRRTNYNFLNRTALLVAEEP